MPFLAGHRNKHLLFNRFTNAGTYKIDVTFTQPSSKLLTVEIKCPTVTIVSGITEPERTCFPEQQLSLSSLNAINNITSTSPVLLLPYTLQHNLEPTILSNCSEHDFIYSFYLLAMDASQWKYSRTQRYPSSIQQSFQEAYLSKDCSELGPKSTLTIEPKSLSHGYYVAVFTVSISSNPSDFRQFTQPIEIIRSDLETTFGGNDTITNDHDTINLDFHSSTIDPDTNEFDRRKVNFTLLCYPAELQPFIFIPNTVQLGATRPSESNPQNHNSWFIQWNNFTLVSRRSELNVQIYENHCLLRDTKQDKSKDSIQFDAKTKTFNISDEVLDFSNGTLYFVLIVRHLTDGRQLVARLEVDKQTTLVFDTDDLSALEDAMGNLDNLAATNPKKAVELVSSLADKLNEMSDNSVSAVARGPIWCEAISFLIDRRRVE